MGGKVALVTGGTSGIGKAAATALAAMGADVVLVGRNPERGEEAAAEIRARTGGRVDLALADLSSQAEVRALADEFKKRYDRLDVLVNNAGLVQSTRSETVDGLETTFAINHLAPFLLTNLLMDLLKESAPSRVVTVSSEAERWGNIDFDDLQSRKKYRGFPVYGMTKLANIMFTYELAGRLKGTGVTATCMHPGAVNTRFGSDNSGLFTIFFRLFKPFMRTPEQGADTLIWLASSPEVEGVSGRYYSDRKVIEPKKVADDPQARRRLWEESERLTGLKVTA
ncbi:SDR family NAD(P)-dependent oxidoreductase [Rubrobacter tropicus]|uniref:SDR family NAD(P)-dependent oxidoreductase n=2 Tax=Rubrobacter tropicus TaxID=2653851 RepID=A0A6G8QEX4_9ACTN|nr:SDR family NAD(P)-dependent oxidoreductase [Rubrobacter tropicus]